MKLRLIAFGFCLLITNLVKAQEMTAEMLYKKINDAIVSLYTFDAAGNPISQGSGVVINQQGWIVTNYHVYGNASKIIIKHKNKEIKDVEIIASDIKRDLLILKIDEKSFPSIIVGNSDLLNIGQKIYAVGSPFGFENSISDGIISGIRTDEISLKKFIQISSPISPGSSGGALINSKGELVGITTSTYAKGQNLNFAIPVNDILKLSIYKLEKKPNAEISNLLYKAEISFNNEKYDAAASYLTRALGITPNDPVIYQNLGIIYIRLAQYANAISYLEKAVLLDKGQFISFYLLGKAYYRNASFPEAESTFQEALKLDPTHPYVLYMLGILYSYIDMNKTAITYFKNALQYDIQNPEIYHSIGMAYANEGFLDSAIIYFKKVEEFNSYTIDLKSDIGFLYLQKDDISVAEKYFAAAIRVNNNSSKANFGMGKVHKSLKNYENALFFLNKTISVFDTASADFTLNDVYIELGSVLQKLDRNVEAISYYKKAIAKNLLGDDRPYFNLGYIYKLQKDHSEAIRFYKKAIKENPDNPVSLFNLSLIYRDLGNKALWKYYEDKAAAIDPKFGTKKYLE